MKLIKYRFIPINYGVFPDIDAPQEFQHVVHNRGHQSQLKFELLLHSVKCEHIITYLRVRHNGGKTAENLLQTTLVFEKHFQNTQRKHLIRYNVSERFHKILFHILGKSRRESIFRKRGINSQHELLCCVALVGGNFFLELGHSFREFGGRLMVGEEASENFNVLCLQIAVNVGFIVLFADAICRIHFLPNLRKKTGPPVFNDRFYPFWGQFEEIFVLEGFGQQLAGRTAVDF